MRYNKSYAEAERRSYVATTKRTPDVVDALLKQFVRDVPDARHRTALRICAHTRLTTESLLREAMADDDVRDVFDWLRDLSFIEQSSSGLFPHDLARDVLEGDFRWRDPDGYVALHRAVRAHVVRKMMESSDREQQRWMFDLMFLHRSNPIMKPYWQFKELGTYYVDRAKREEYEDVLDLTVRHSGHANAHIMQRWLERQPEAFFVVRGRDSLPLAFITIISLTKADAEDVSADPAIQPMMNYMQRHAPLRPADEATLCRFVASREDYLKSSPVANAIQMATALHWMTTPHLAWSFVAYPEPEHWQTLMTYVHYHRAYEADYVIGNVPVGVYAHDWRAMPVPQWLEVMGGREIATDMTLEDIQAAPPAPLLVLSQPEFEEAVKSALRDFVKPKLLASNPLLRSRLAVEQAGGETPTPATLQSLLREASRVKRPTHSKLGRGMKSSFAPFIAPISALRRRKRRLPRRSACRSTPTAINLPPVFGASRNGCGSANWEKRAEANWREKFGTSIFKLSTNNRRHSYEFFRYCSSLF